DGVPRNCPCPGSEHWPASAAIRACVLGDPAQSMFGLMVPSARVRQLSRTRLAAANRSRSARLLPLMLIPAAKCRDERRHSCDTRQGQFQGGGYVEPPLDIDFAIYQHARSVISSSAKWRESYIRSYIERPERGNAR